MYMLYYFILGSIFLFLCVFLMLEYNNEYETKENKNWAKDKAIIKFQNFKSEEMENWISSYGQMLSLEGSHVLVSVTDSKVKTILYCKYTGKYCSI